MERHRSPRVVQRALCQPRRPGAQVVGMLLDVHERRDMLVRTHRDVPARVERPRQDCRSEMRRRRPEPRRRQVELGLERLPDARGEQRQHRLGEGQRLEQPAIDLDPLPLRVTCPRCRVARGPLLLGQPNADQPQDRAAGVDVAPGHQPKASPYAFADTSQSVDLDRALEAVAGASHKLVEADRGKRMAAARSGQPAAIDRIEWRRRIAGLAAVTEAGARARPQHRGQEAVHRHPHPVDQYPPPTGYPGKAQASAPPAQTKARRAAPDLDRRTWVGATRSGASRTFGEIHRWTSGRLRRRAMIPSRPLLLSLAGRMRAPA